MYKYILTGTKNEALKHLKMVNFSKLYFTYGSNNFAAFLFIRKTEALETFYSGYRTIQNIALIMVNEGCENCFFCQI